MDAQQTARLVEGGELPDICTETVLEHNPEWAAQHCEMLADFVNAAQTGTPCTAPGAEGLNEVQLAERHVCFRMAGTCGYAACGRSSFQ